MSTKTQQIKLLRKRITEIDRNITPLVVERAKCYHEILELKSEFEVGQIIQWGNSRGKIVEIRQWIPDVPQWLVRNILKDGSEGSTRLVREYDNPTAVVEKT